MRKSLNNFIRRVAIMTAMLLFGFRPLEAGEPKFAPVPPSLEIEVLDPKVDPLGNPAVQVTVGDDSLQKIEIPPTVLVHRFYYSGNRSFQGPMLRGGPTIIVANHPKTGERLYIDTQMFPGAPRVIYRARSIEYDFGAHGVVVEFPICQKPKVTYRTGRPIKDYATAAAGAASKATGAVAVRTGIPQATVSVARGVGNATLTVANRVRSVGKAVLNPVCVLATSTPISGLVLSSREDLALDRRDQAVTRAEEVSQRAEASIPTNR